MKDYIFENYTAERLLSDRHRILEIYHEYGVAIFPRLLRDDSALQSYLQDLRAVMGRVIRRHSNAALSSDLGEMLVTLCRSRPIDGKIITDLGTQPNKFFSFNRLKFSGLSEALLEGIFGPTSTIVTPQAGDTLHFFPPDKNFYRYNLPPHQDYQYLMQSPRQTTFYLGLSDYRENVGGLRLWEKSHRLGILKCSKNQFGSYEILDSDAVLKDFVPFDYEWNTGDFGVFDSLLAHSSIPNASERAGRVVQIFRFSDINDKTAESYNYYSTAYERRGVLFTEVHADLYEAGPAA